MHSLQRLAARARSSLPALAAARPSAHLEMPNWLTELGGRKRAAQTDAPSSGKRPARKPPRTPSAGITDLGNGSVVIYVPNAIPKDDCEFLFEELKTKVNWATRNIKLLGREVQQPRMVAYMADDRRHAYTYSGTKFEPDPWDAFVLRIKTEVEKYTEGHRFDSCLLNLYRTGTDHMGWHSDDEPLYGTNPVIGSVSLGAARDFLMRRRDDHSDKVSFNLKPGDVLIMKGTTQLHWAHCIPKRLRLQDPRINLTFRKIVRFEQ